MLILYSYVIIDMVYCVGCRSGEFMCVDGERCIFSVVECDGRINCFDRFDEYVNCSKFYF